MKVLRILFLLLVTVFLISSCSSSGSSNHDYHGMGYKRIVNNTAAPVTVNFTADGSVYTINPYSYMTFEFAVENTITGPKSFFVAYSCHGLFLQFVEFNEIVNTGLNTARILDPDQGGIKVKNNSSATVTEVYLKSHSTANWGNNRLTGIIAAGNAETWPLVPGSWDVKVIDGQGHAETWENNDIIEINQMMIINYPSAK